MGQSKTKANIVVCGLDNSGKTTIVNQLKPEERRTENIAATVGYSVEMFTKGRVRFTAFDMGGAKKFRSLWESYYATVHGVVFVIDSTDTLRICVVQDEIEQMLSHPELRKRQVPFLFFANKMDLAGAKTPHELVQLLNLATLMREHPFNLFASDALTGVGLDAGMQWLEQAVLQQQRAHGKRSK